MAITEIIKDSLLRKGNPKKFILISDSIWDKPLYVIESEIKKNMNQLGIDNVYFASCSGSNSYDFINGKNSASKDTVRDVINECVGDGGADTIVMWALGINDVGYTDKVYNYDLDFIPAEKKIISAVEYFKAYKPNVKIVFVSAPVSAIATFTPNYEIMYKRIADHFNAPMVSGYEALKGVRRATQHTNANSAFYLDGLHPSQLGLLRFWNYIMMSIVPDCFLKNITPYNFPTPVASPNDQIYATVINNGWRNDFWTVAGILELKPTNEPTHWCFTKYNVLEGQLFTLKLPTGLMGTFIPEVKWVTTDGKLVAGAPTKLPPLAVGQDRWLISAPFGVNRLHVNISDNVGFNAAYTADPTICHLGIAYARTEYNAPIEDIMIGFPNLLDY